MAFTSPVVFQGSTLALFNLQATADADTGGAVTHGLTLPGGVAIPTPANILAIIVNILQVSAGLSLWAVTAKSATQITCTKSTAVGSGNAAPQAFLIVMIPHTIIQ